MAAQKAEKPLPLDRAQLGVGQRLRRDLIDTVRKNRVQAEHGAGSGHAHDHLTILEAARGQLQIPAANQIEAACVLALCEQRGLRGKGNGAGGQLKIGKNGAAQGAKPTGAAIGASCATHRALPVEVLVARVCFNGDLGVCHRLALPALVGQLRFCLFCPHKPLQWLQLR